VQQVVSPSIGLGLYDWLVMDNRNSCLAISVSISVRKERGSQPLMIGGMAYVVLIVTYRENHARGMAEL